MSKEIPIVYGAKLGRQLIAFTDKRNGGPRGELSIIKMEKALTLENALEDIQLKKLEQEIGEDAIVEAITFYLIRLNDHFNVGKKFTIQQAVTIAFDILERYPYESFADIVLMLKMVRQGILGDGKDFKIDSQTIFHKWLPEYLERKAELREKRHQDIKKQLQSLPQWSPEQVEKFQVGTTDGPTIPSLGQRLKNKFNNQ